MRWMLAVLLAGCLSSAPPIVQEVEPLEPRCLPDMYTPADVCAQPLGADGDRWAEPYVAAHPTRAGVFAVAAQGQAATGPCSDEHMTCLFITEDAGRHWRTIEVGDGDLGGDPLVEFQGDKLHVAALDWPGKIRMYTTSDMGRSWSSQVIVEAKGTDRPWMQVHGEEIMFVWQTAGEQEGWWRHSPDGGKTWGDIGSMPCNLQTQPHWAGRWFVACGGSRGTELYAIGKQAKRLETLPTGSGTRMMSQSPDGILWITAPGPIRAWAGTTPTTWSDPIDLARERTIIDWVHWAEAPPWGGLLALVQYGDVDCILNCAEARALPTHLVHVGVDGTVHGEWKVAPGGIPADRPVRASTQPTSGEFGGIACQEVCLVAWMVPNGVDLAWFRPTTTVN